MAEGNVAMVAKKPPDLSSGVVVVDTERSL
jgi:hypothetical protein